MARRESTRRLFVVLAMIAVVALFSTANGRMAEAIARAQLCAPLCVSPRLLLD